MIFQLVKNLLKLVLIMKTQPTLDSSRYNPVSKTVEKPEKPTQKRVNSVPVPVEMNFTENVWKVVNFKGAIRIRIEERRR